MRAFDRARDYDAHAGPQQIAARRLADRIAARGIGSQGPAIEIGCGTGFLTEHLLARWPDLPITVSDIASAMLERTRARIGAPTNVRYAIIDGECPPPPPTGGYKLILSNLAFQWFGDQCAAITAWAQQLAPGGALIVATLAKGSFDEWKDALAHAGISGATPAYPEADAFRAACPPGCTIAVDSYRLPDRHENARHFAHALRAIGANAGWATASPTSPATLRKALHAFEAGGSTASYVIAEIEIRRKGGGRL